MRPSQRNELWYRAELRKLVHHLRQAGSAVAEGMRPRWPVVLDERAPGLDTLLRAAAAKFGNIRGVAQRLAQAAARRNLSEVDRRLAANILTSVGVDISAALTDLSPSAEGQPPIRDVLADRTAENVALITSIPEQYLSQVGEVVSQAWEKGTRWETLVKQIAERGEVAESRAALIARDQTSKLNAAFNEVRQTGLGIDKYTWSTSLDERVRPEHEDLEGKICRWNDPPIVDGEAVHPGEAINCRCVALPILDVDEVPGGGGGQQGEGEEDDDQAEGEREAA